MQEEGRGRAGELRLRRRYRMERRRKEKRLADTRWWWLGAGDSLSRPSSVELLARDRGFSSLLLSAFLRARVTVRPRPPHRAGDRSNQSHPLCSRLLKRHCYTRKSPPKRTKTDFPLGIGDHKPKSSYEVDAYVSIAPFTSQFLKPLD